MEGTRHERVALVIASYLIGFITAFIGFGVDLSDPMSLTVVPAVTQTASSINAIDQAPRNTSSVELTAEGLEYSAANGDAVLLTASLYSLGEGAAEYSDGVFVGISTYDISPDDRYVYFCEQPSREVDSCKPFVYSVGNGVMYPVTINGERVAFANTPHTVDWGTEGPRTIAGEAVDALPK